MLNFTKINLLIKASPSFRCNKLRKYNETLNSTSEKSLNLYLDSSQWKQATFPVRPEIYWNLLSSPDRYSSLSFFLFNPQQPPMIWHLKCCQMIYRTLQVNMVPTSSQAHETSIQITYQNPLLHGPINEAMVNQASVILAQDTVHMRKTHLPAVGNPNLWTFYVLSQTHHFALT